MDNLTERYIAGIQNSISQHMGLLSEAERNVEELKVQISQLEQNIKYHKDAIAKNQGGLNFLSSAINSGLMITQNPDGPPPAPEQQAQQQAQQPQQAQPNQQFNGSPQPQQPQLPQQPVQLPRNLLQQQQQRPGL